MTPSELLSLPLRENDANAATVGEYLKTLLTELWKREDDFSGKRPFGNSGWKNDVYSEMIRAEIINGKLDDDGYIVEFNESRGEQVVLDLIEKVFGQAAVSARNADHAHTFAVDSVCEHDGCYVMMSELVFAQQRELGQFRKELDRVRPFATAYKHVLKSLNIENDVVGYANGLKGFLKQAAQHFIAYDKCPMCAPDNPVKTAEGAQIHRPTCWVPIFSGS